MIDGRQSNPCFPRASRQEANMSRLSHNPAPSRGKSVRNSYQPPIPQLSIAKNNVSKKSDSSETESTSSNSSSIEANKRSNLNLSKHLKTKSKIEYPFIELKRLSMKLKESHKQEKVLKAEDKQIKQMTNVGIQVAKLKRKSAEQDLLFVESNVFPMKNRKIVASVKDKLKDPSCARKIHDIIKENGTVDQKLLLSKLKNTQLKQKLQLTKEQLKEQLRISQNRTERAEQELDLHRNRIIVLKEIKKQDDHMYQLLKLQNEELNRCLKRNHFEQVEIKQDFSELKQEKSEQEQEKELLLQEIRLLESLKNEEHLKYLRLEIESDKTSKQFIKLAKQTKKLEESVVNHSKENTQLMHERDNLVQVLTETNHKTTLFQKLLDFQDQKIFQYVKPDQIKKMKKKDQSKELGTNLCNAIFDLEKELTTKEFKNREKVHKLLKKKLLKKNI